MRRLRVRFDRHSGDAPRRYLVEGIGEDFIPKTFNRQVVDEMVRVSDRESFLTARRLAREEGILAGGSCGTAQRLTEPRLIVVLLPDTGRNYLSKMYDDEWMREQGFWPDEEERHLTVGDVLNGKRSLPRLIAVGLRDRLRRAVDLMHMYNISQIPVLDGDRQVGCLTESTVMKRLFEGLDLDNQEVSAVMGRPLPELREETDIAEAYRLFLSGVPAALVVREGQPAGVITRADVIARLAERKNPHRESHWSSGHGI